MILAIEDELPFVELLRALFRRARIDYAPALAVAFDRLAGNQYDLVILDLELIDSRPEQTLKMIPEIRTRCGLARVLVMSGHDGFEREVRKHNAEFLSKGDAYKLPDLIESMQPMKTFRPLAFVWTP